MADHTAPQVTFRRSSRCTGGTCVEIAALPDGTIAIRDSKDAGSPLLRFTVAEWTAFLDGAASGEFAPSALGL